MTRRHVTLGSLAFLASIAALSHPLRARETGPESYVRATEPLWAYFGTYTQRESKGIYVAQLDPVSGALSEPVLAATLPNFRLTLLSPDIVEPILDGRQLKGVQLEDLTRAMSSGWEEQRRLFSTGLRPTN